MKLKLWLKIFLAVLFVIILALAYFYFRFKPSDTVVWGLNFSQIRARELGFEPRQMYADMITDLKPKKVRLMAYWSETEPAQGQYDFSNLDWMLNLAQQHNTEVILVIGRKVPRWPECHQPDWVRTLPQDQQDELQLKMVHATIEHLKSFSAITTWQVENEPLFSFGYNCPTIPPEFVKVEISLVKSLDTRPVLVTDSGESGLWIPAANLGGDIFGSTMYRLVYNPKWGYFKYPLPAQFYRIKAGILETFTHIKKVIGVELQMEPWFANGIDNTDLETQKQMMNAKVFQESADYAKKTGFSEHYLWGVEWWYWMAKNHNDWGMWTYAKDLLGK